MMPPAHILFESENWLAMAGYGRKVDGHGQPWPAMAGKGGP